MIKLKHLILSTVLIASPAISGKLMVSETLKVLEINGVEHSGSFLAKSTDFDISSGEQKLLLKYQEFFEDDDENFSTIRSKPFLFSFTAQGDQDYFLNTPELDSESDGKEFAKKPTVIFKNSKSEVVVANLNMLSATSLTAPKLVKNGHVDAPKTLPTEKNIVARDDKVNDSDTDQTPLTMLSYWWQQASPEQKQAFLSLINK